MCTDPRTFEDHPNYFPPQDPANIKFNPKVSLTPGDAFDARRMYSTGEHNMDSIAKAFHVSRVTIRKAIKGLPPYDY